MTACYIDSAFPAALHFAYKYADSVEAALLANANAGGENVARGSLIGALVGAYHGVDAFPLHLRALKDRAAIEAEVDGVLGTDKSGEPEAAARAAGAGVGVGVAGSGLGEL